MNRTFVIWQTNYQKKPTNTPPSFLMDPTTSPKVMITEGEGIGACSLVHITLGVEGRVGAPRSGLGRLTNKSITHMDKSITHTDKSITHTDLHKLNNKLVSA
jgi:hypothetical protein